MFTLPLRRLHGALALVALLPLTAMAQKAALVQDVDSPGRAPYLHEAGINPNTTVCPNSFYCQITLPAVPAGRRLVVTHASAEFTNGVAVPGTAYVTSTGTSTRIMIPASQFIASTSRMQASGQVTYYVEAGQSPVVQITGYSMLTSNSAFGAVAGYLVTVP